MTNTRSHHLAKYPSCPSSRRARSFNKSRKYW